MKILVCGGRNFSDKELVYKFLNYYTLSVPFNDLLIITGGATGADTIASNWAKIMGVKLKTYFPDWNKYGKSAGPIRNQSMIDNENPDILIAFYGGNGTKDMVGKAKNAKIPVIETWDTIYMEKCGIKI